ncbi:hypothetical protein ABPG77_006442 [Micractinium sp. CCAP 211/92]
MAGALLVLAAMPGLWGGRQAGRGMGTSCGIEEREGLAGMQALLNNEGRMCVSVCVCLTVLAAFSCLSNGLPFELPFSRHVAAPPRAKPALGTAPKVPHRHCSAW